MRDMKAVWQNKKVRWGILIGLCLLILTGLFWKKNTDATHITYQKITVTRGDLESTILSTGIAQPENRLEIKPPIAGRVDQVMVDEGDVVKTGQILMWMSSTERAALLDAARARGPSELRRWEEFYKATPILAPIDGTIILRSIEPGQTFTTQDSVLVMSDRLTIQAQVDETDIAAIKLKQPATITLDAYPNETMSGQVEKIAYDAKTVNNVTTYLVDVLPEKIPDFMRSGMTANVSFQIDSKKNVLCLPAEAVKRRDGRSYVLTDSAGKSSSEKEITTGLTDGKRVEIVSGLAEGETVVAPQLALTNKSKSGAKNPLSPMRH